MISLADSPFFAQGLALLKNGVPYECIFGPVRPWPRNWRNAAIMVLNEMKDVPEDSE